MEKNNLGKLDKTAFREYDIRGKYPSLVNTYTAYKVGLAFGTSIKRLGKKECVVGHDNRLTSPALTKSLIRGITETGINVKFIGLVTTPMYYFACLFLHIDSGVMVTASHNPKNDNGFKIALANYDNACGKVIMDLYELAKGDSFESGIGKIDILNIRSKYTQYITKDITLDKKLKVVVDPANGTGSIIVRDIFGKLNADIVYINDVSNGNFPNHHPDPLVPENMEQLSMAVIEEHADLGIGFDGDADRVGFVDENGKIIPIDTFMAIVWDDLMPNATNKTAVYDVKCSKLLEDEIIKLGGKPLMYRTGNSYQKRKVKTERAIFGGELSGHVYFRDRFDGFDDGIYAGLRMMEIMSKTNKSASELYSNFNKYYSTPEIKVEVTESAKFDIVEKVKKYCEEKNYPYSNVDGVRVLYEDGFALVRASNTGPNLTLRFEAKDEKTLESRKQEYLNLVI